MTHKNVHKNSAEEFDDEIQQEITEGNRRVLPELRERYDDVYEDDNLIVFAGATAELNAISRDHDVEYSQVCSWMRDRCPISPSGITSRFEYGTPLVVSKAQESRDDHLDR